jgi:hypothetical protein
VVGGLALPTEVLAGFGEKIVPPKQISKNLIKNRLSAVV